MDSESGQSDITAGADVTKRIVKYFSKCLIELMKHAESIQYKNNKLVNYDISSTVNYDSGNEMDITEHNIKSELQKEGPLSQRIERIKQCIVELLTICSQQNILIDYDTSRPHLSIYDAFDDSQRILVMNHLTLHILSLIENIYLCVKFFKSDKYVDYGPQVKKAFSNIYKEMKSLPMRSDIIDNMDSSFKSLAHKSEYKDSYNYLVEKLTVLSKYICKFNKSYTKKIGCLDLITEYSTDDDSPEKRAKKRILQKSYIKPENDCVRAQEPVFKVPENLNNAERSDGNKKKKKRKVNANTENENINNNNCENPSETLLRDTQNECNVNTEIEKHPKKKKKSKSNSESSNSNQEDEVNNKAQTSENAEKEKNKIPTQSKKRKLDTKDKDEKQKTKKPKITETNSTKTQDTNKESDDHDLFNHSIFCEVEMGDNENDTIPAEILTAIGNGDINVDYNKQDMEDFTKIIKKHNLSEHERFLYIQDLLEAAIDKLAIPPETKEKIKELQILVDWEVPPAHLICSNMSAGPSNEEKLSLQQLNVTTGKFTAKEDEIIRKNWIDFVQKHDLEDDPLPFTRYSMEKERLLSSEQRKKFSQYIGRGLPHKSLFSVFRRFRLLYKPKVKHGRFSPEEDELILTYLSKIKRADNKKKYARLAPVMNRDRLQIERRYRHLKQASNESSKKIVWTLDLKEKFVKHLLAETRSKRIEDLRDINITYDMYALLSKLMNIPASKLRIHWTFRLYTELFAKEPLDTDLIKIKLIEKFHELECDDWKTIDWNQIADMFDGITKNYLWILFKNVIKECTPDGIQHDLKASIDCLYENQLPVLQKRKAKGIEKILPRLRYENGKLEPYTK